MTPATRLPQSLDLARATNTDTMSGALLIRGYGQNVPPCTNALGQWAVFGPGGSRTCGFKAALPCQRLRFCAIPSNVAVRSYDGALRSLWSWLAGLGFFPATYAGVMVPGTLELNLTQRT